MLVTDDVRCIDANAAAARFFGCAREELLGVAIRERAQSVGRVAAEATSVGRGLWIVRYHLANSLDATVLRATHDLNNALAIITSYAGIMSTHPHADDVCVAAKHAAGITGQLEALVRNGKLGRELVDVNVLVTRVAPLVRAAIGRAIELRVDVAAAFALVHANATQLERAIANLAVNAREAMPNGGTLTIATASDASFVVLTVSDTGRGMDERTQRRAFEERFSTKGDARGSGLAIVRAIVEQHDGRIGLRSAPGMGTAVEIRLPCGS